MKFWLQNVNIQSKNAKIFNPSVPKDGGESVNGEVIAGGDSFGCKWAASELPAGVVLR